jgi:outer membrane biosynthesis protein TonB
MRTDYILYVVAVACFIVAGSTYAAKFPDESTYTLISIVLAIIGVIFIGSGYAFKPQKPAVTISKPTMPITPPMVEEKPALAPPASEPEPEPTPTTAPLERVEAIPPSEVAPETPAEAPSEPAPETMPETKKPARKRRERKKT